MPRGRPVNHGQRIQQLIGELRAALVARAQAEIEDRVNAQIVGLRLGLGRARTAVKRAVRKARATMKKAARPSAGRRRQIAAMKAYWRKKRAAGRGKRVATAKPAAKAAR
jgi:hypothetical protein